MDSVHKKLSDEWFILGAGAMGCLWAVSLKEADVPCTFILRDIQSSEIKITLYEHDAPNHAVVDTVSAYGLKQNIHKLILAVKANDAVDAINSVRYALAPAAEIILLQNGLGTQEQVARLLPGHVVWAVSTTHGVWREKPWIAHHAGRGFTWLGAYNPEVNIECSLPLMPRINVCLCDNIHERLWHKLAINSVINGLTAKYQCQNGELTTCGKRLSQIHTLAAECENLLKKKDIQLSDSVLNLALETIAVTENNRSSTLQDVLNNRITELNWINGFVISEANRLGVEVRAHKYLMHELSQMGIY